MLNGVYTNPTTIYFGKDAIQIALERIPQDIQRVLLVYGRHEAIRLGIVQQASSLLSNKNIECHHLRGVEPNPKADKVYEGIIISKTKGIDLVIAVGGGSVIDTAKSISAGALYDGDFFDFYLRKDTPKSALPLGTIVTIAGSGSESSDGAVIERNGLKYSCGTHLMYPRFSVLDPTYTMTVPKHLTACGIVDSISHVLERYFSKTTHVSTSTELCEAVMRSLMEHGEILVDNLNNYDLRAEVMWASKLAHDGTIGFGRKHDWATHTIAHELGARYDRPHGELLGVLFPAWMTYVQKQNRAIFSRWGRKIFGHMDSDESIIGLKAIHSYKEFINRIGLPTTLT
ncbi:MAG: iron-containing alcohol dehydrogenase, partial [Betaproteobacteria bacterium]|nr:iron-containing alcohol dehydrogenase [Betaproteobacteria bacterium]